MRSTVMLLALAAAGLTGCGGPGGDTSLFPLDAGHRWTYQLTTELENSTIEREERQLITLGRADLDGQATWQRRSDDGANYWLRSDDSGIYRVASKSDIEDEPKLDATRRYVLKRPYAVGTQWQTPTTAYLLEYKQDFPHEVRHKHPSIPMNYVIEAVNQKLETAAGKFDGCLRVKGLALLKLYADPVVGWRDVPLTTLEWYCPGVGLVRLERDEPGQSTFISGGRVKMELVDFH
ncbi:MAG: hypothetical protein QFE16_02945 [Pseudomonadota bacterium]|nr:hypothetical protein [Pseudomonadota bacterium]